MTQETRRRQEERLAAFTQHRPYLFAVAYRMLGIAEDAEDVLQEAWLRFEGSTVDEIENPRAYLVTIVSRLALDTLRSARRKREEYVGEWLPEPVLTEEALPADLVELAESASFAFLLLMERLNPMERVILVLHDVFDVPHLEIAEMTGRTAVACRQTLRRARQKLGNPPAPVAQGDDPRIEEFLAATREGNLERLVGLLAPDVVLISDGGGKAEAINRPLAGSDLIGRFMLSMARLRPHAVGQLVSVNGQPAVAFRDAEGEPVSTVFVFDATPAGITALYVVRNPDKLRRLERSLE